MALLEHSSKMVVEFPKLAKFLKWFPSRDKQLTHEDLNQIAYEILPEEQFSVLAEFLEGNTFDKKAAKWAFYLKSSRKFALYIRPILMAVPFEFYKADSPIMEMISLLKKHYITAKSPSDLKLSEEHNLIPKSMIPYLKRKPIDEYIDPHLFEFFVYQKMYHQLDRGRLFCNDSVSYCDIENDLVDDALVDDVEKIATKFGYPKIPIYCDGRLDDAIKMLDDTWDKTIENVRLELNTGFNLIDTKDGKQQWNLLYDASEKLDDIFFKNLPKVEIANVVMFIGDLIGMWDSFSHIIDRYIKKKPTALAINACLLSEAFGFGAVKTADISDLNLNILRSTHEDFVRVDTLCAANDLVSNFIHSLPIFKLWNLLEDKTLADADGQKFATSDHTIQSRYSKKYIVAYLRGKNSG